VAGDTVGDLDREKEDFPDMHVSNSSSSDSTSFSG